MTLSASTVSARMQPFCYHSFTAMKSASLTIRNIPVPVLKRLRSRAERHHRSMQGEILAILEAAATEPETRRTVAETLHYVRTLGLRTPAEAAAMIRADRDGR